MDHYISFPPRNLSTRLRNSQFRYTVTRATTMSTKSFARMTTKDRSPCYLLMINLPRSADDECMECTNSDVVMTFREVFPLALPQTLPPPRTVDNEIKLIPNSKLFSRSLYQPSRHEAEQIPVIVEELLGQGIIRPSGSPRAAEVLSRRPDHELLGVTVLQNPPLANKIRDMYPTHGCFGNINKFFLPHQKMDYHSVP